MKRLLALALVSTLVLSSCSKATPEKTTEKTDIPLKYIHSEVIEERPFSEEIRFSGRVSASRETPISAQAGGTIASIGVKVGAYVKAWQILATLDTHSSGLGINQSNASTTYMNTLTSYEAISESIKKSLENAEITLENTKTSRDNTYTSTEQQLKLAQVQVNSAKNTRDNTYDSTEKQQQIAQTQLDNIKTQKNNTVSVTDDAVKSAQIAIDIAEKSLENAKTSLESFDKNATETLKTLNSRRDGLYDTARVSIGSTITSIESAMTQADMILSVSDANKDANAAYALYLSVKNSDYKTRAEQTFLEAQKQYQNYLANRTTDTTNDVDTHIDATLRILSEMNNLYDLLTSVLDNSITSSTFTSIQLDALKLTVATKYGIMIAAKTSFVALKNSITDINNSLSSTQTQQDTNRKSLEISVSLAETQAKNAKQALANVKSGNTSNLDTIEGNTTLTQKQLENTLITVKSARDSVDNALTIAQEQYNSAIISVKSARDSVDNAVKSAQAQTDSLRASLESQLAGSKTQLDASKGQKDLLGVQIENTAIKAPFDGIILAKNTEVGGLVMAGTPVFIIGDNASLIIKSDMSGDNASILTIGQDIGFQKGTLVFTGSVSLLSPATDPTTHLYKTEFLPSPDADTSTLVIGDYVDVYASKSRSDRTALLVPFSSIIAWEQGIYRVYVIGSGSVVSWRDVKVGEHNSTYIEITSGLTAGERVVTSGALNIGEGDTVAEISGTGKTQ